MLAFLLLALSTPVELELPAGAANDAWERARQHAPVVPEGAQGTWPRWPSAWENEHAWSRWEALVAAPRSAASTYDLALLARAQGRDDDLWAHFAALDDAPALVALEAKLFQPTFLGQLVILRPPLPPPAEDGVEHPFVERQLSRQVDVKGTSFQLIVRVEPDGTQVDLNHLAGPPLEVQIHLPTPPSVRLAVTYADWARQDDPALPLTFSISAEDPEHTGWGRYLPEPREWPRALPEVLPASVQDAGLELVWAGDTPPARLAPMAQSLGRLLGVPARVVTRPTVGEGPPPLRFHLGAESATKEIDLVGRVERWALRRNDR